MSERIQLANLFGMALLIALTFSIQQALPKYRQQNYVSSSVTAETQQRTFLTGDVGENTRTTYAKAPSPSFWSRIVARIGGARQKFIMRYRDAGSNIDADVQLTKATDLIRYFPRATIIGFFAPFPNMWLTSGKQVGLAGRLLAGLESFVTYIVEAFALFGLWHRRRQFSAWLLFLIAATGMIALGFVVVNIGALFRMRYLFLILIIILGAEGAANVLERFSKKLAVTKEPYAPDLKT